MGEHDSCAVCLEEYQSKSWLFGFYAAAIFIPGWLAIDLRPYQFGKCVPGHIFAIRLALVRSLITEAPSDCMSAGHWARIDY